MCMAVMREMHWYSLRCLKPVIPVYTCAVEAVRGKGYITLKRARVEMARGNMRLAVGRSSSISEASGETFKVKVRATNGGLSRC